jgi:hypothetical protein
VAAADEAAPDADAVNAALDAAAFNAAPDAAVKAAADAAGLDGLDPSGKRWLLLRTIRSSSTVPSYDVII